MAGVYQRGDRPMGGQGGFGLVSDREGTLNGTMPIHAEVDSNLVSDLPGSPSIPLRIFDPKHGSGWSGPFLGLPLGLRVPLSG